MLRIMRCEVLSKVVSLTCLLVSIALWAPPVLSEEIDEDEVKAKPKWFASSLITNSIFQSFFNTSLAELNVGHVLGRNSSLQLGFAFSDADSEGEGSRVASSSPDDQRPDDIDELEIERTRSFSIGYFHRIGAWKSTGLRLGLLFVAGNRETKDQGLTQTYSENNPADYTQIKTSAETERDFTAVVFRSEIEHSFTPNFAVGIIQDFFYEIFKETSKETTLSRAYSSGVQVAADDPTESKLDTDGRDLGTSFKGLYVRIYF